ncbi:MAG: prepilin peptidase, partial [Acidobacteriaceae bacterium]|nr:prepilin peptidase [Acidobacteriaceae bacterium]
MAPESQIAFVAIATIVGLVTGSFLNVCIYRIPRDVSIVFPRSFCVECGKQISWYDNVPLLSYALLHGRCRFCRKPIELRYPIVELMTAVVFIAIAIRYGWSVAALKWAVFEATLIVLFWTDLEERILPDELTLGGFAAGLIFA